MAILFYLLKEQYPALTFYELPGIILRMQPVKMRHFMPCCNTQKLLKQLIKNMRL